VSLEGRANDVLIDRDRQRPATNSVFSLIGLEHGNGGGAKIRKDIANIKIFIYDHNIKWPADRHHHRLAP